MINNNSFSIYNKIKIFKNDESSFKRNFKDRFKVVNIIMLKFFIILLLVINICHYIINKAIFRKKLKIIDYKNLILNFKFDVFYSYLNTAKNKSSIFQLLKPKDVLGKNKVRIGREGDGGYILLNDFENIKFAYSFGISYEISFDKALADKNIDVFMYDHTIEGLPIYNPKLHWKKIGLTEKNGGSNNMKTLDELIKENFHEKEKNMILKMDIEGPEWNILNELNNEILKKFKYIIIEFHFNIEYKPLFIKVLKKLTEFHQIFHLHCNNCATLINIDDINICLSLEVSLIIKENNTFIRSSELYPVKNIDFKNCNKEDFNNIWNIYHFDNLLNME